MKRTMLLLLLLTYSSVVAGQTSPKSAPLIRQADELFETGRFDEALTKYEEAEKADPSWDGFPWLEKFMRYDLAYARPELQGEKAKRELAVRTGQALARSARRHPERADVLVAMRQLAFNGDFEAAFALGTAVLKMNPRNVAALQGEMLAAASLATSDPSKAADAGSRLTAAIDRTLEISNRPEELYFAGAGAWEFAAKTSAPPESKSAVIRRGRTALDRAIKENPGYIEAIVYLSLLIREEAKLTSDPAEAERLTADADRLRANAMELMKRKSEGS